jgi:hypothetical protein
LTEMGYPSGYNLVRSIDLKRYHDW